MSDADVPDPADTPAEGDSPAAQLLALQALDTAADQLRTRRERLDERAAFTAASQELSTWERRRAALRTRLDQLTAAIEEAEAEGETTLADRQRLEAQMKTIIAPREAEALMHEIDAINARRDELDDAELAALEEQSTVDDDLTAHLAAETGLRDSLGAADQALANACADIDAELATVDERREQTAAGLDASIRSRYETVRAANGVAVSTLRGPQCTGCHLELSAAEIDTAKDESVERGYTDCPQCGRLLVVGH